MHESAEDYDPFDAPSDPEEDQEALIAALQMLRGFGLFFAVTNSATERNRRMDALVAQFPGKRFQRIAVDTETYNLLWHLREVLSDPKPEVLFVYGLENWISDTVHPRSINFLLNLNATRDSFPLLLPAPMVFWVPQYVLRAIANAAPDFFSVRSGVYVFPISEKDRTELTDSMSALTLPEMVGTSPHDKTSRLQELQALLSEYRMLPFEQRNELDEARILVPIAGIYNLMHDFANAESNFAEALEIERRLLTNDSPRIATVLNGLGDAKQSRGKLEESLSCYSEALRIRRKLYPPNHPRIASVLSNIASLFLGWGYNGFAENLLDEAFEILSQSSSCDDERKGTILNNLGQIYFETGRYEKAEANFKKAIEIAQRSPYQLGSRVALSILNLVLLYETEGKMHDAFVLIQEGVQLAKQHLGKDHPITQVALERLAALKDVFVDTEGNLPEIF